MNTDNNPSRQHHPNRWARLKKQLKAARAEAATADRLKAWAYLYITQAGQWQEFDRWAQEQAEGNDSPTDALCNLYAQAVRETEAAQHRLNLSQKMGKMYSEQAEGYYKAIGTLNGQVTRLLETVGKLTDRVIEQREEIAALKKQRQHNECNGEGDTPDLNTAADRSRPQ